LRVHERIAELTFICAAAVTKLYRVKLYLKPIASKDNQFSLSSHLSTLPEQDIVAFRIVDYSPFRSARAIRLGVNNSVFANCFHNRCKVWHLKEQNRLVQRWVGF